jgi:signal transduction histidine kinase
MNERSRFFASLSHELRTPINAVIGYNHLLQEKIFGSSPTSRPRRSERRTAAPSTSSSWWMTSSTSPRSRRGKLEIFPEAVDLAALLRDTATSVQLQAREKGIDLEIRTPDAIR